MRTDITQPPVSVEMQRVFNTFRRAEVIAIDSVDFTMTHIQRVAVASALPTAIPFTRDIEKATEWQFAPQLRALLPLEQNPDLHYFMDALWLPEEYEQHFPIADGIMKASGLKSLHEQRDGTLQPVLSPFNLFKMEVLGKIGEKMQSVRWLLRSRVGNTGLKNEHTTLKGGYEQEEKIFEKVGLHGLANITRKIMTHESRHDNFYLQFYREASQHLTSRQQKLDNLLDYLFGTVLGVGDFGWKVFGQVMHELTPRKTMAMDVAEQVSDRIGKVNPSTFVARSVVRKFEKAWEAAE